MNWNQQIIPSVTCMICQKSYHLIRDKYNEWYNSCPFCGTNIEYNRWSLSRKDNDFLDQYLNEITTNSN